MLRHVPLQCVSMLSIPGSECDHDRDSSTEKDAREAQRKTKRS